MRLNRKRFDLAPADQRFEADPRSGGHSEFVYERAIVAYGTCVGIRSTQAELLDRALEMIPGVWKPSPWRRVERVFLLRALRTGARKNSRSRYELYGDEKILDSSEDSNSVLESFERQLKIYLAEMARRRVFVHAGAVGWEGKAIIVPGRSFSGKTNLVAELVRAGATYYSDEYAVLDERGRVHPYASPLEIRQRDSHKQTRCPVEELGGEAGTTPLPVGLVVVCRYKVDADWRPSQLSPGRGMLELLANTIPARRKPEAVIATLRKAVAGAVTLKSDRGEAKHTAKLIFDHLTRCPERIVRV